MKWWAPLPIRHLPMPMHLPEVGISAGRYCHLDPQLTILKKFDDITKYHDIMQKAKSKMINHLSLLYHILLTSF